MRTIVQVLCLLVAVVCLAVPAHAAPVVLDATTAGTVDAMLDARARAGTTDRAVRIERISARLLGTPYGANMLIGSADTPEQLVIDLRHVDCFTFLDYVDAASRSATTDQFVDNLIAARYIDSRVEFTHRKHFFTDWAHTARISATDITADLSPAAVTTNKHLNAKADGTTFLPGVPVVDRTVTHIPTGAVDGGVVAGLRTGDFIGAYTPTAGLDVTHVGILVHTTDGPMFRNASSLAEHGKVVDTPLLEYVRTVPGILVLRPR
ncbi:N-acetylmuramoyl-L-alanine amidase-like domain-containing protein [Nocardia caishijiensis]|uniref:Uncharacterized protein DUF1460 n=1 Tax=Nocardia caishijiensis TaxID=184756 RepID=A0ABQ6YMI0_9NOCA|nr:N-acetylmuramoyl-L-alanine amidase-like domain-containing protein [Nocardia caishijiensis]KAF0846984.1 uncharacterized protein DUF1460 [Nocardia caishijiensis]